MTLTAHKGKTGTSQNSRIKYKPVDRHGDDMFQVIEELDSRSNLRMAEHGSHAFSSKEVIDAEVLIRDACGRIVSRWVQLDA